MKLNLLLLSAAALFNAATATSAVNLGTSGDYAILAKSGISTASSSITGNIAVSPAAATYMTGFGLTMDSANEFSTSTQVEGQAFASDYAPPTPAKLTTAVSDMEIAYTDAGGRPNPDAARINLGAGTLGGAFGGAGAPLTPGVYTFGSNVGISDDIYFQGSDTDVFIIQMTGNLVQVADTSVILDGVKPENVFWQVAGHVEVGTGAHLEGIVLVKTKAVFKTNSSILGRVLAQTACTLQSATITQP
jgi:hypothetical protein